MKKRNKSQKSSLRNAPATGSQSEIKALKTEVFGIRLNVKELKADTSGLRREFSEFKDKTLTNQDAMLKKLDILLTEKTVREYQEEKEKKLWAIVIKSLREHRILSSKELEEIARLEIF